MKKITFYLCGKKGKDGGSSSKERVKLFSYYGCDVYLDEAMIYAKVIEESYEAAYGEDIWNITYEATDGSKVKFEDLIKDEAIEQMKMVKVMITKAKEEEISEINDIGSIMAKSVKEFFLKEKNIEIINSLKQSGVNMEYINDEEAEQKLLLLPLLMFQANLLQQLSFLQTFVLLPHH